MTLKNIQAAFRKTGIFPFNSNDFAESDLLAASETERPFVSDKETCQTSTLVLQSTVASPENVKDFPKAEPRKLPGKGRKQEKKKKLSNKRSWNKKKSCSEQQKCERKKSHKKGSTKNLVTMMYP